MAIFLRTGDRARVRFRFSACAECLRVGTRFIFRDGRAKGIGKIVSASPSSSAPPAAVPAWQPRR